MSEKRSGQAKPNDSITRSGQSSDSVSIPRSKTSGPVTNVDEGTSQTERDLRRKVRDLEDELSRQNSGSELDVRNHRRALAQRDDRIEKLREELRERKDKDQGFRNRVFKNQADIVRLRSRNDNLTEENGRLREERNTLRTEEIDRLSSLNDDLSEENDRLREERNTFRNEVKNMKKVAERQTASSKAKDKDVNESSKEGAMTSKAPQEQPKEIPKRIFSTLISEMNESERRKNPTNNDSDHAQNEAGEIHGQADQAEEVARQTPELNELKRKLTSTENEIQDAKRLKEEITSLESQVSEAKQDAHERLLDNDKLKSMLRGKEEETREWKDKYDSAIAHLQLEPGEIPTSMTDRG